MPEHRSHDYVRTGKAIGSLHRRHRTVEFAKFLAKLDKEVPASLDVHFIVDNYATHKTPMVKQWLLSHPRFHLHFAPTGSSWMNLVEQWFTELTQKNLLRGVSAPPKLSNAASTPGSATGTTPRPFIWTKTIDEYPTQATKPKYPARETSSSSRSISHCYPPATIPHQRNTT
ncbi:transposase [Streptomyces physcomitrii]